MTKKQKLGKRRTIELWIQLNDVIEDYLTSLGIDPETFTYWESDLHSDIRHVDDLALSVTLFQDI